ncbi:TATA-binding protein-associated factor 172 [Leptidea sinapis]|uniref:TATA-binding protein-associated factor 172 n=1 Tax=Leptidea sinapis TaxID=189913 RepID=UPI0021C2D751|nr:TATA-binding protein-associated factor 172 [Leptidea sinapis]
MPGLLGSERQFTARYSRPILAARDPKATPHHLQAGARACEALHRQVLPFLLRRVKEDVLRELPPKITQDYYCDLSPLQRSLYEHFSSQHLNAIAPTNKVHVFQALHYLQNVCNHPKLVLKPEHPELARVQQQLAAQRSTLSDIQHSAKLPALKQLLMDCGIGADGTGGAGGAPECGVESVVSQHRALVFCQLKAMLDIVEQDLLRAHLPSVTYLRLDGSVPPQQRHAIVSRFNADVSIDLLLLTTSVGGLGLNLSSADTVIFVEHDWNPMKDLQAMDRAHRIGQRRVVNVYRLVTRDTLEEKIMGLQKFKLKTANTVISSDNAAMETMGTDQLLDLFQLASGPPAGGVAERAGAGARSVLDALPDLWDDKQYEEEYDMANFIKSLNKVQ